MPLTVKQAKAATPTEKTYRLADGGGLYLEVTPTGGKYWRMKYRFAGKEKRLAIGVYPDVTLKAARVERDVAKLQLAQGVDPSANKRAKKLADKAAIANSFEPLAREWFAVKMKDRSKDHRARTLRAMERDLFPALGRRPVSEITPAELLQVLRKIEARGTIETAHRVKQTASAVFRYGVATSRCERDPSTDLKGALGTHKTKHLAAITNPAEAGRLMLAIEGYTGTPAVKAALQCSALWFCRPGEVRHLEWSQVNWDESRLEFAAEKTGLDHIVPLSHQSLEILRELEPITGRSQYVFPSARGAARPLSENGVRTALRTLGYTNEQMTPHGFRAMARTLLDEVLGYPPHIIEQQLAHAVKDAMGRAYNRTQHLKQRQEMMQHWADYLDQLRRTAGSNNVISASFCKQAG